MMFYMYPVIFGLAVFLFLIKHCMFTGCRIFDKKGGNPSLLHCCVIVDVKKKSTPYSRPLTVPLWWLYATKNSFSGFHLFFFTHNKDVDDSGD